MIKVITFGSAVWDIFMRDKKICFKKTDHFFDGKGVYFPLGAKIEIDEINFSSGGGGTNAAATFSFQGIKTAYCGMVGNDPGGERIIRDLKNLKINTSLIRKTDKKATNHSFILSVADKDRTILSYKGASEIMSSGDVFWNKIKKSISKEGWFYLAPMNKLFEEVVDFGFKNKIKIAVNPGKTQLNMPKKKITKILKKTNILVLNREEASVLTGISYQKEKEILKKIKDFYQGILIITNGSKGALISDSKNNYKVGILKSKVVDRTGAGDSFASGFVSGIINNKDTKYSIQLASANATECLKKWGSKNGLLKKGESFKKIKVEKQ